MNSTAMLLSSLKSINEKIRKYKNLLKTWADHMLQRSY
ncbi:MAG: hypothetical protein UU65_C0001G0105 [candidate division CPR2 bacterium GW2011_GWC1_41_48]|uniref:Uncharacterized protein n=1 Tax=candidate division CPR2 bacterium GW2011_GWC1_41_48 TaxID=1618344 RepID=A0A0G0W9R8_UNCC2|nr:MAG: hypothetical protein UT47_C0001G0105 [candidate division CPR2 bacterium GW2011_GWC2_39_35]KKR27856.1 MAG: hypothetical protein UT60_C0034G0004 [candidate division CPR2 bacterium GW2011_GWD2_39_7]KKR28726.1 MAG: hypothetical protein UT59_C0020G0007 [candidate division CPR2 bacterium GW2011_GWD1_39_7]KKS09700.1 MAG: hypothetical protein UU65_C0001G0105 [candidate division CPR2 bacterium GW2011_GWC1_41_48]